MSEERTFTQDELNKLIGEARVKAREKAKTELETQAAKDKAIAEQTALIAQNEWQKLAEQHGARVQELEPLEAQVTAYEELIKGMLKDSLETLGETAKQAVKGLPKSMSAIEKLNWLNKNQELFQANGGGVGTPKRAKAEKTKVAPTEISRYPLRL